MYLIRKCAYRDISFESTQNKQQYGTKIICTEVREKSYGDYKFDFKRAFWGGGGGA